MLLSQRWRRQVLVEIRQAKTQCMSSFTACKLIGSKWESTTTTLSEIYGLDSRSPQVMLQRKRFQNWQAPVMPSRPGHFFKDGDNGLHLCFTGKVWSPTESMFINVLFEDTRSPVIHHPEV